MRRPRSDPAARPAPRPPAHGPRRTGLARVARRRGGERRAGRHRVPWAHPTAPGAHRRGPRAPRHAAVRRRRRLCGGPLALLGVRPRDGPDRERITLAPRRAPGARGLGAAYLCDFPGHRRGLAHAPDGVDPGRDTGASGALLTTIVLGVAAAQLAAPPLMVLALRTTAASPAAPAPLTPAAAPAELSANAPADWPR